jgi:hypothetical protein
MGAVLLSNMKTRNISLQIHNLNPTSSSAPKMLWPEGCLRRSPLWSGTSTPELRTLSEARTRSPPPSIVLPEVFTFLFSLSSPFMTLPAKLWNLLYASHLCACVLNQFISMIPFQLIGIKLDRTYRVRVHSWVCICAGARPSHTSSSSFIRLFSGFG